MREPQERQRGAQLPLATAIWNEHVVGQRGDGRDLLYVDRVLMDEVRAPQALALLEAGGRAMRRPDLVFATIDHSLPTRPGRDRQLPPAVAAMAQAVRSGAARHGFRFFDVGSEEQGISHVIAPQMGLVLPGATYVCSDSHAATVGALGALALGCGTTDLAHILATQTLAAERMRTFRTRLDGALAAGVDAKDVGLALIGHLGIHGARGFAVEYAGPVVDDLPMEQRFTLCNMAIEMGARSAIIAPDATTLAWLENVPWRADPRTRDAARERWRMLRSEDAAFERVVTFDCSTVAPQITWGTDPSMVIPIGGRVPDPAEAEPARRAALERALNYMGLQPGDTLEGTPLQRVFIGSCTNARLDDLRTAAQQVRGKRVAPGVRAIVVPGSTQVKHAAEALGLDRIFLDAGFEWHDSGCAMCSSGGDDVAQSGERVASTSNRNFEDRQGRGARTHLVSPRTAAASALAGRFVDVREA
jgi:3-isopropylmalate/(R)-2-methylmalate dehydratase large subunit